MNKQHAEYPKIIYQSPSKKSEIGICDACSPVMFTTTGQCDACSPVIFTSINPHLMQKEQNFYLPSPNLILQPLDSNHYAIISPFAKTFSVLNTSAVEYLQTHHMFSEEINIRKIQEEMIQIGLLMSESQQKKILTSSFLENSDDITAWLHLTNQCNLRCIYCYLDKNSSFMSLKTGKSAIEATFRSAFFHHKKKIKFKYAGGEPLLRYSLIVELHKYASVLAQKYGFKLGGVIISNGTLLTERMINDIKTIGLQLTISLDHLPSLSRKYHQRIYPNGQDSSKEAIEGIELALKNDLVPGISITVSGRNIDGLSELLEWVLNQNLPFRLNFYRRKKLTQKAELDISFEKEKIIYRLLQVYKLIERNLPKMSLLDSLLDMTNFTAPHLRRCSVGHNYIVFDCDGNVSKCQMKIEQTVTDIHCRDPLSIIRDDTLGIQNITVDKKEGCQDCQWRYWCAGGCPLETYNITGKYNEKSPHCSIYKTLYPEILRLEGLRLLNLFECNQNS